MQTAMIDRRVARTRKLLHQALMSLTEKKDYATISVGDICDAAEVRRSTFYAHYSSKDDLRRSGLDHMRAVIVAEHKNVLAGSGDGKDRTMRFSLTIFKHARDHMDRYRSLPGSGNGAIVLDAINQIVSDLVHDELAGAADSSDDAVQREVAAQYVVGAFMAVLTWWLDGGAKLPPERIDAMFRRLAAEGVLRRDS